MNSNPYMDYGYNPNGYMPDAAPMGFGAPTDPYGQAGGWDAGAGMYGASTGFDTPMTAQGYYDDYSNPANMMPGQDMFGGQQMGAGFGAPSAEFGAMGVDAFGNPVAAGMGMDPMAAQMGAMGQMGGQMGGMADPFAASQFDAFGANPYQVDEFGQPMPANGQMAPNMYDPTGGMAAGVAAGMPGAMPGAQPGAAGMPGMQQPAGMPGAMPGQQPGAMPGQQAGAGMPTPNMPNAQMGAQGAAGQPQQPGAQPAQPGAQQPQQQGQGAQPGAQPGAQSGAQPGGQPAQSGQPGAQQGQQKPSAPPRRPGRRIPSIPINPALARPGRAKTAMIMAILSVIFSLIAPLGFILALLSLNISSSYRHNGGRSGAGDIARIFGTVGLIFSSLMLALIIWFVGYYMGYGEWAITFVTPITYFNNSPIGQLFPIPVPEK